MAPILPPAADPPAANVGAAYLHPLGALVVTLALLLVPFLLLWDHWRAPRMRFTKELPPDVGNMKSEPGAPEGCHWASCREHPTSCFPYRERPVSAVCPTAGLRQGGGLVRQAAPDGPAWPCPLTEGRPGGRDVGIRHTKRIWRSCLSLAGISSIRREVRKRAGILSLSGR